MHVAEAVAAFLQVPLVEGALQNAPADSVESFLLCAVRALHDHVLPKPGSNPKAQVGSAAVRIISCSIRDLFVAFAA